LDTQLLEQRHSPTPHTTGHDRLRIVTVHEGRHGARLVIPIVGIGHNRHRLDSLIAYIHKREVGTSTEVARNPTI
jgi:hypothetical protein